MMNIFSRVYRRLTRTVPIQSPLSDKGERVDIDLCTKPVYAKMDMYQKSHYQRYLFATQYVRDGMVCGDFACGSGYGTVLLAERASEVIGVDIKQHVIEKIAERYAAIKNVKFVCQDLRRISFEGVLDLIVSFETIEHVEEHDTLQLLSSFSKALKVGGAIILSVPYKQERSREAVEMGFHLTFNIDEAKISSWLEQAGLVLEHFWYQNYQSHNVVESLKNKDFIICIARKPERAA